jgi:hypothetical protein
VLHTQLLRHSRILIERLRLQPFRDFPGSLAEGGLLQGLGGHFQAEGLLPAGTQRLERLALLALLIAGGGELLQELCKIGGSLLTGIASEVRLLRQGLESHGRLELRQGGAFQLVTLALLQEPVLLIVELLDARALHLGLALPGGDRPGVRVAGLLPGRERTARSARARAPRPVPPRARHRDPARPSPVLAPAPGADSGRAR